MADTLAALTPDQWAQPSLCRGWTVRQTVAHIVTGAEQPTGRFLGRMAANGRGRRDTARPNAGDDLKGPQRGGLAVLSRMTSSVGSNT